MTLYEEEIDLRPYLLAIIQHWRRILILGIIPAVIAVAYGLLQTRTYTASATILITRSRAVLSLAEDFPTVSENVDTRARSDALLSISQSDALAREAYTALGQPVQDAFPEIQNFREQVSVIAQGDSLRVTATAPDPDLAAAIATQWAEITIQAINQAYSGNLPLDEIAGMTSTARDEYTASQAALEEFYANNDLVALNQTFKQSQELLSAKSQQRIDLVKFYTTRSQEMEQLRLQAESLKRQMEGGNQSTAGGYGDALALLLARASALGIQPLDSVQLSFNLDNPDADTGLAADNQRAYASDLDAIVELAAGEIDIANAHVDELTAAIVSEASTAADQEIIDQLLAVNADLEKTRATERELTSNRDLAWSTYQTLTEKQVEIQNAGLANNAVSLASSAVPPLRGDPRGTLTKGIIAGVLGVLVGLTWTIGEIVWVNLTKDDVAVPAKQAG